MIHWVKMNLKGSEFVNHNKSWIIFFIWLLHSDNNRLARTISSILNRTKSYLDKVDDKEGTMSGSGPVSIGIVKSIR